MSGMNSEPMFDVRRCVVFPGPGGKRLRTTVFQGVFQGRRNQERTFNPTRNLSVRVRLTALRRPWKTVVQDPSPPRRRGRREVLFTFCGFRSGKGNVVFRWTFKVRRWLFDVLPVCSLFLFPQTRQQMFRWPA